MIREELIARLGALESGDRAWLLGELPPALRRELAQLLADEAPGAVATPLSAPVVPAAGWETLDPERVADVLAGEPVWLVSATLRATDARWRERVLAATPARRRHEIEMADRSGGPLGARAAQRLLEACRTRLADAPPATATRGGFAALVEHMRSRFA